MTMTATPERALFVRWAMVYKKPYNQFKFVTVSLLKRLRGGWRLDPEDRRGLKLNGNF
jgi:hypothetical protein